MRKYIILFFSVFPFLLACNHTPGGIIGPDEMVALLTDVHITDGTMISISQAPDSLYKYGMGRYQLVFARHNTDSAQFRKSLRYYTTQPDELTAIYDQVMKNLQFKSDSINKLMISQGGSPQRRPVLSAAQPGISGSSTIPATPAAPPGRGNNNSPFLQRNRAIRDSIMRKYKKLPHAIP